MVRTFKIYSHGNSQGYCNSNYESNGIKRESRVGLEVGGEALTGMNVCSRPFGDICSSFFYSPNCSSLVQKGSPYLEPGKGPQEPVLFVCLFVLWEEIMSLVLGIM